MEGIPPNEGSPERTFVRTIGTFVVAMLIVAVIGATIGWMLGSVSFGAVFGAVIGFYGCFRSGYVMGEPNQERPGF